MAHDLPHTGIGSAILTLAALVATGAKCTRRRYRRWRARAPRY